MKRIVVELTNRCNLSCNHCFAGRHGGNDDLSLDVLRRILQQARLKGFDHLAFTGGDPTVHRRFVEIVRATYEAGYRFSLVTNGFNFTRTYPKIAEFADRLDIVTFSCDGATSDTHDRIRGRGSFIKLMQAVSYCFGTKIPFGFNMVLHRENRHELGAMAHLAERLGAKVLRFGHLMPTTLTASQNLDFSPEERKSVEHQIRELTGKYRLPIALAPGVHSADLAPCDPLRMQEVNIDCNGWLTKCCHLSGHGEGAGTGDVIANLSEVEFDRALSLLETENMEHLNHKALLLKEGKLLDSDRFPCWYCSLYYEKVGWLQQLPSHPWKELLRVVNPRGQK